MRFSGALTNTKVSENTISGNGTVANQAANVNFIAATDVHFFNNNVGTLPDGNTALVNLGIGIILNGSSNNKIGGSTPNEGNIIGSHNINGLHIIAGSSNNTIDYNKIGVGTDGTTNIGNGSHGIVISGNNTDNKIVNNTIANNKKGVELNPTIGVATKVKISKNSIYNNSVLGIDLIGTTANDVDDLDTGVNNLQNSPEISAINYLGNVSVEVTYNVPSAVTNSAYPLTVEFFGSDNGQGKKYISSDIYTLPGDKTVTLSLPNGFEQNDYNNIVATATDENGNTSEFGTSVNYSLGISPIVSNSLKIFPNPTRDIITIQSNANETLTIDVFDVYGRNVLNKKSANTMNVSSLASGVYLLKIKDENGGVTSAKIIKQ